MSGVSPTVVCVTPDTQIYFFDHPKRQPQTLRLSFSVSHLQTAKRNVPAHALWQVNCGFRSDSVRYSLPWSLKCDHSCCNALCCQLRASHLQAYAMVAKGLFFRIPSLRSECYNLKRDFIIMFLSSLCSVIYVSKLICQPSRLLLNVKNTGRPLCGLLLCSITSFDEM